MNFAKNPPKGTQALQGCGQHLSCTLFSVMLFSGKRASRELHLLLKMETPNLQMSLGSGCAAHHLQLLDGLCVSNDCNEGAQSLANSTHCEVAAPFVVCRWHTEPLCPTPTLTRSPTTILEATQDHLLPCQSGSLPPGTALPTAQSVCLTFPRLTGACVSQ